ncbi:hypothetical protein C7S14_0373 [Burkholderia cepacia]|nr:hypothetical protein C7S14_0373 [Burkholderia cepacia]
MGVENPGFASCVPWTYVRRKRNRCAHISSRHGLHYRETCETYLSTIVRHVASARRTRAPLSR